MRAKGSDPGDHGHDRERLVHELSVHEAELNIQNEELRRIQLELEASRDRFALLYDIAPVGYLTLDSAGLVREANLTAARLLGLARQELVDRNMAQFVTADAAIEFALLLARAFSGLSQQQGIMAMRRAGGLVFYARLVMIVEPTGEDRPAQCLVALDDVTRQHEAERRSLEHLAQLQGITESARDGMITVDGQYHIVLFNQAAETMFGREAAEMIGQPVDSLIPTGLAPMHAMAGESGDAAGGATPTVNGFFQAVGRRADGEEFPLEASVSEIAVGQTLLRTAIIRDISRRLRAEAERTRLAAIVENSFDAILTRNRANIVTTWNAGAEAVFGYTAAEIVGRPYSVLVPTQDRAAMRAGGRDWARNRMRERTEAKRITKDRRILTVSVKESPLCNGRGEIVEISEILRDITREREAEENVRQSEKALKDFFDNAPVGLVWVQPGGLVVRTNLTHLAMVGRKRTGVVGHRAKRWFAHPESVEQLEAALRRHRAVKNFRSELRSADGSRVHVLVDAIRAAPGQGRKNAHWFIRDITARLELESRFLQSVEEERMRVGAELHDDLGQQLAGIQYLCEAEATEHARQAKTSSVRAHKIALLLHQAITHVGLLARGLSPLGVEDLSFDTAVRSLAENTQSIYKCECNVRSGNRVLLRDPSTQIHVYRIIQEAINNAVRHGHAGRIDVALKRKPGAVEITVEDDGRGLNPARSARGAGLGLKIMRYRAQACGGSVALGPREGGGAKLTCLIPVQPNPRRKSKP